MTEFVGLYSHKNLFANFFSCHAVQFVTLLCSIFTYSIIQCWRGKSFLNLQKRNLSHGKKSFLIAQTARLPDIVENVIEKQEKEKLLTDSTQEVTAQTNSLEKNSLVLMTCKQGPYSNKTRKIRCRNLESLKRAQIQAYQKKKFCMEEDTLYEFGNLEMPEVDFTANYFAKLQAIQDHTQLL